MEVLMIKLDEKDVRAVASSRFYREKVWWIIGGLFFLMGAFCGLAGSSLDLWVVYIPIILTTIGLVWLGIGESRAKKALVKDWRENGCS